MSDAAKMAGISKARWSQIENGWESRDGQPRAVSAPDGILARMADAIGLEPDRLEQAGRRAAAAVLTEMRRRPAASSEPYADDPDLHEVWASSRGLPDDTRHGLVMMARKLRDRNTAESGEPANGGAQANG